MLFTRLAVPYDDTDRARRAFSTAVQLIDGNPDAVVYVVRAFDPDRVDMTVGADDYESSPSGVPEDYLSYDDEKARVDRFTDAQSRTMRASLKGLYDVDDPRIHVVALLDSSPVHGIVEFVKKNKIDLVVMGRRDLGAIRAAFESVSEATARELDAAVLTVR